MESRPAMTRMIPERQADKQANVMKDQLRKEVAYWNALARRDFGQSRRRTSVCRCRRLPRRGRHQAANRAKPAATPEPKPAGAPKKPFSMSFDGVTDAEHISYMIARGAR